MRPDYLGWDTETHLIRPGRLAPRLVCLSLSGDGGPPGWLQALAAAGADLVLQPAALGSGHPWWAVLGAGPAALAARDLFAGRTVAHNAPYDLAVLSEHAGPGTLDGVLSGLAEGRHRCTKVREKLLRIATGELEWTVARDGSARRTLYDLASLVRRYLGVDIGESKSDPRAWRLRYAELDGVPVRDWPEAAVRYAAEDAVYAVAVARAQDALAAELTASGACGGFPVAGPDGGVATEARETAAATALHLMACWGVRTDGAAVDAVTEKWRAASEAARRDAPWVRVAGRDRGKPGSVDLRHLRGRVEAAYALAGEVPPRTPPSATFPRGQVKTDEETLDLSGDPDLERYADGLQSTNWLSKWAAPLRRGCALPLTSSPNVLVGNGRCSWADPPLQQPPRSGGVRECFVPRPGWILCAADYSTAELRALAQVCLWLGFGSRMAEEVRAGRDLHLVTAEAVLAAEGRPLPYDALVRAIADESDPFHELATDRRQLCKPVNFGFPGGLGPAALVAYARKQYGVVLGATREAAVERARELRETWLAAYPEVRSYFGWISSQTESGEATCRQFVSGRVRGGVRYTAACNTYFSGLVADGAKLAAWWLCQAAYTGKILDGSGSPIAELREAAEAFHGCRPVLHLHDEVLAELPEDRAGPAAAAMALVMRRAMERHVPDVPIECAPALMRRWVKGAKPYAGPDGLPVLRPESPRG